MYTTQAERHTNKERQTSKRTSIRGIHNNRDVIDLLTYRSKCISQGGKFAEHKAGSIVVQIEAVLWIAIVFIPIRIRIRLSILMPIRIILSILMRSGSNFPFWCQSGSFLGANFYLPGSGFADQLNAVFRIRIRIHIFFGLPDPDPYVRGMNPNPAPDPSVIMKK